MNKPSKKALGEAAQCWSDKETSMIEMDTRLAFAFARRLDNLFTTLEVLNKENEELSYLKRMGDERIERDRFRIEENKTLKEANKSMHSLIDPIVERMFTKLYGPKHCDTCKKVQPIYVFQLEGSQESKLKDSILTQEFMGSRVCRVCGDDVD